MQKKYVVWTNRKINDDWRNDLLLLLEIISKVL